jgi:hypothetical protein
MQTNDRFEPDHVELQKMRLARLAQSSHGYYALLGSHGNDRSGRRQLAKEFRSRLGRDFAEHPKQPGYFRCIGNSAKIIRMYSDLKMGMIPAIAV